MILTATGTIESVARFITVLLTFLFVLALTYYTSKFIANYQKKSMLSGNMEVMETTRIAQNKYLQIVRAGDRYFMIAVCKDTVTMLSELEPEQLDFKTAGGENLPAMDFKNVLEKAKTFTKNARREKKQADKDE